MLIAGALMHEKLDYLTEVSCLFNLEPSHLSHPDDLEPGINAIIM